jgi:hypothetical protein
MPNTPAFARASSSIKQQVANQGVGNNASGWVLGFIHDEHQAKHMHASCGAGYCDTVGSCRIATAGLCKTTYKKSRILT